MKFAQKPQKAPKKGAWDLTFLSGMWYNDDDYNKPVSPHPHGEAGRQEETMLKLFELEDIKRMMGSVEPR